MATQKEWQQEVRDYFKKISSHKKTYSVDVDGIEIDIFPNVFSPAYFTDSKWFAENVREMVGKHSLLEIGTGTGIIALFSALNGASVSATDINPSAAKNAKHNFKKHGIEANVYCEDMYNAIPPKEKFDFIFWNHPFNKGDNPNEKILLKSGFDYKYNSLDKYIAEAHLHLNPTGRILLGTGNFALLSEIKKIATKYGYKMKLLRKIEIPLATDSDVINDYRIYEFKKVNKK